MGYRERVLDAIQGAEQKILGILAEEATEGRYEGIDFTRAAAVRLRNLHQELAEPQGVAVRQPEKAGTQPVRTSNRASDSKKRGKYPRFGVSDGSLLKVGWSKKEKAEYSQRVPEASFRRVAAALAHLSNGAGGTVTSEQILARIDAMGDSIPSYQTYAVLGFLRSSEVLRPASRGQYFIPADVGMRADAAFLGAGVTNG